jgi:hypothetical protein
VDDLHFYQWRAEEEVKRGAGADLLAHIRARAEAEQVKTERLLDTLTRGTGPEQDTDNLDDLEEAA